MPPTRPRLKPSQWVGDEDESGLCIFNARIIYPNALQMRMPWHPRRPRAVATRQTRTR